MRNHYAQATFRSKITVEQLFDTVCMKTVLNRDEACMAVNRRGYKFGYAG